MASRSYTASAFADSKRPRCGCDRSSSICDRWFGCVGDATSGRVDPNEKISMMRDFLRWMIKGYQNLISPLLPPMCRFYPSCSQYAVQALRIHGAFAGTLLAGSRILRCNPMFEGGCDPVPARQGAHCGH